MFLLILLFTLTIYGQKGFHFLDKNQKHTRLSFRLINNLIIIPLEINNKKVSFVLDSGVSKTILFNISQNDSISLKNIEKVQLQGLGKGESIQALVSENNKLAFKGIISTNEKVYILLKDYFDLSDKMGITINGIIGYNLLSKFIVKINYKSKKIDLYNPKKYVLKKCRKCEIFPIQIHRRKPYIYANVQLDTIGVKTTKVKLLIDSGGSDALWLFEGSKESIKTPKRFFIDILGEGLSGIIYGNRSRIPKIKIGSFNIIEPTVSFLDTVSSKNARLFKTRHGSIGAGILKRFKVWFDYPNKQIMLRKNASLRGGFNYNMSGLDIVYTGKQLVKQKDEKILNTNYNKQFNSSNTISFATSFSYKFKPTYKIRRVVENSAADNSGLKEGDIILTINRKLVYNYTLNDITNILQEKENKKIRITIEREGEKKTFLFRLEKNI